MRLDTLQKKTCAQSQRGGRLIYPNYYFNISDDVPEQVKSIVEDFRSSDVYQEMLDGDAYYTYKNTAIMERKRETYVPTVDDRGDIISADLMEDAYVANNKLCSGYVPLLIDQLNQYLLSNKVTYDEATDNIINDIEVINVNKLIQSIYDAAIEAQKKSIGWVYFFINNEKLDSKSIPSEEIVPIFNENGDLTTIIRAYVLRAVNAKGDMEDASIVEVYDSEKVSTYIKFDDEEQYHEWNCYDETNEKYYIVEKASVNGENRGTKQQGFGRPPFQYIEFKGDGVSMLTVIKTLVDVFDVVNSDFANNFEDFQDSVNVVKNYAGEDINTFLDRLKKYRVVMTEDQGDFQRDVKEVPHEARVAFLGLINDLIFKQGMGVDTMKESDGNITNFVMTAKYKALDDKAAWFGTKIEQFYNRAKDIINAWLSYKKKTPIGEMEITFNKNVLLDPVEQAIGLSKLDGWMSKTTGFTKALLIEDVNKEFENIEEEQGDVMIDEAEL